LAASSFGGEGFMSRPTTPTAAPTPATAKEMVETRPRVLALLMSSLLERGQRSPSQSPLMAEALESVMAPVMEPARRPTPARPKPTRGMGRRKADFSGGGGGGGGGGASTFFFSSLETSRVTSSVAPGATSISMEEVLGPLATTTCLPGFCLTGALRVSGATVRSLMVTSTASGLAPFTVILM
jgi:hypothetical protein